MSTKKASTKKKAENKTLNRLPECPECNYNIQAEELVKILKGHGMDTSHSNMESLFSSLRKYEDYSVLRTTKKPSKVESTEVHQTEPPFEQKIVKALFWIPKKKVYKYLKLKLAPSNIKAAGIGVYSVDAIPKGAKGVYKGEALEEKYANMYYSWTVKSFYLDTGEPDEEDEPLYYVDATKLETSNWTRYVNCGMRRKHNNFDSDQLYDKFFYVAMRDIESGEELFIDYGPEYRKDNLGMLGSY